MTSFRPTLLLPSVAVNVCGNGLAGVIQLSKEGFSIQPVNEGVGIEGQHILWRLPSRLNLTDPDGKKEGRRKRQTSENKTGESLTGDEDMFTWYEVGKKSVSQGGTRLHIRLILTRALLPRTTWRTSRTPDMLQIKSGRWVGTRFSFCFSCDTKSRYAVLLFY